MKIIFLCLLISITASAEEITLRMGVEDDEYYRSSPSYAQIKDYFKSALKMKGINVEYVEMPAVRIGTEVEAGRLDGDFLYGGNLQAYEESCFPQVNHIQKHPKILDLHFESFQT